MSDDSILVSAVRINQYLTVASSALYLYDLLLTLDLEVDLLWPAKWTPLKVIYLLQRYLPLINLAIVIALNCKFLDMRIQIKSSDSVFFLTGQFGGVLNPQTCEILFRFSAWSFLVGMTFSEGILMLRTLALWGNSRKFRIALILFSLCCMIPVYLILGLYYRTLTFYSIPSPGMHCFATGQSRLVYLFWVFLTVYDTGIIILTAIPGFRAYRSQAIRHSTLTQVLYRDGILHYAYMLALSALNIVLILNLPADYAIVFLSSMERVTYSVLTSHVVLHLREQAYRTQVVMTSPCSVDVNAEAEFLRSGI
ncbi:hypothetical protein BDN72DRAFT_848440 [Pluteus cervinus]|uniref:Uncharacterized protein n=1 Tax=Pluteus cervinus TaxID=181527 RepID=A0ACD3AAF9_9AGAR|nr:hypothetical protein BDN72DRAFT_848440 [Pluteus cervinus]